MNLIIGTPKWNSMNKLKRILIMITVVLLTTTSFGLLITQSNQLSKSWIFKTAFPWLKDEGYTTDTSAVELTLVIPSTTKQSITFRIPKAYLTTKANWKSGVVSNNIEMQTGLPDLKPRLAKSKIIGNPESEEYKLSLERFNNGLFIYIEGDKILNWDKNFNKLYEVFLFTKLDKKVFNLTQYDSTKCKIVNNEEKCRRVEFDYYSTSEKYDGIPILYRCLNYFPDEGCTATTVYKNWEVQYGFRTSQLYRWQEFDTAVRKLLDQFYVSENNQPK